MFSTQSSAQFASPQPEIEHLLHHNQKQLLCLSPDNVLSQMDDEEAIAESV